jgi:hypothetical protein
MIFNAYVVQNHLAKAASGIQPELYGMSANSNIFLHQFATLLRGLIKNPDLMEGIKASHRAGFIELLQSIVRRHEALKTEAETVQLLDYYMYIHQNSPLGDVVSRAEFILRRSNTLDQPAN